MLQVENLVVKYGNIAAVKGISLDVAEGRLYPSLVQMALVRVQRLTL